MSTRTYFQPQIDIGHHGAEDRLNTALAAFDLPAMDATLSAGAFLRDEPHAQAVIQKAVADAVHAEDPAQWYEDTLAKIARAQAADLLRERWGHLAAVQAQANYPRLVAEANTALAPAWGKATRALQSAAKALPAGPRPLDLEAVVEADATPALKRATTALSDMARIASTVGTPTGGRVHDLPKGTAPLALAVDLPDVDMGHVNPKSRRELNPDETRDNLAGLMQAVREDGMDNVLVRVARDEWPGVTIAQARTLTERNRRVQLLLNVALRMPTATMPAPTTDPFAEDVVFVVPKKNDGDTQAPSGETFATPARD